MKNVLIVIAVIIGLFATVWIVQGNEFFMYQFFAPRYANTQRKVFENTKSFKEGKIQELRKMQYEYIQANEKTRPALKDIIVRTADGIDIYDLPVDLRSFITELRGN